MSENFLAPPSGQCPNFKVNSKRVGFALRDDLDSSINFSEPLYENLGSIWLNNQALIIHQKILLSGISRVSLIFKNQHFYCIFTLFYDDLQN